MTRSLTDEVRAVSGCTVVAGLTVLFAGLSCGPVALAQAGAAPATAASAPAVPATRPGAPSAGARSAGTPTHYLPNRFADRAGMYYRTVWGIDSLSVKSAESGELIRVSWRVIDTDRARVLNDEKLQPALEDPRAGVSLVIPVMEKIGQLRQVAPPEAGKSYWMAFSNPGRPVKRGDRVNVVVGPFRAENLMVE